MLTSQLHAQMHVEVGVDYIDGSEVLAGVGFYIAPRYALNEKLDVGLQLELNGTLETDPSKAQTTGRIEGGTLPVISAHVIRRFPSANKQDMPYLGLGTGAYLTSGINFRKGIKAGVNLSFGFFLGRSNIGFSSHFVPDANFIQLKYGYRFFRR